MNLWPLQDAKSQFSKIIKLASIEPQQISVHGEPKAVILSQEAYDALTKKKHESLVKFLRTSPLAGLKLNIKRNTTKVRDVDL